MSVPTINYDHTRSRRVKSYSKIVDGEKPSSCLVQGPVLGKCLGAASSSRSTEGLQKTERGRRHRHPLGQWLHPGSAVIYCDGTEGGNGIQLD